MEIVTWIISILAFLLSIYQFFRESLRQKKEATLNAYNELQDEVFTNLNKILDMEEIKYEDSRWQEITHYLSKIENFAVGVNTNIYSYRILNRIGGAYFIRQFDKLKWIIDLKREKNVSAGGHYDEFEKTVERLKKHRARTKKSV